MSESASETESGNGEAPSSENGNGSPVVAQDVDADRLAQPVDLEATAAAVHSRGDCASAGGLEAYSEFLQHTKPDSGIAFVLVQHLSPKHTSLMAELLSKHTEMPVRQVEDGMPVEPNRVYVIRPGYTMTIQNGRLHLGRALPSQCTGGPSTMGSAPLAEDSETRAICADSQRDRKQRDALGPSRSKPWEGILSRAGTGSAKFHLDPQQPHRQQPGRRDPAGRRRCLTPSCGMCHTCIPLRGTSSRPHAVAMRERQKHQWRSSRCCGRGGGADFAASYKKPTLVRRDPAPHGPDASRQRWPDYVRSLRQNPGEVNASRADDLMIHVTGFFRDADVWDARWTSDVIQPMVTEKSDERRRSDAG